MCVKMCVFMCVKMCVNCQDVCQDACHDVWQDVCQDVCQDVRACLCMSVHVCACLCMCVHFSPFPLCPFLSLKLAGFCVSPGVTLLREAPVYFDERWRILTNSDEIWRNFTKFHEILLQNSSKIRQKVTNEFVSSSFLGDELQFVHILVVNTTAWSSKFAICVHQLPYFLTGSGANCVAANETSAAGRAQYARYRK